MTLRITPQGIVRSAILKLDKGKGVKYSDILKEVGLQPEDVAEAIDILIQTGRAYEPVLGLIKLV